MFTKRFISYILMIAYLGICFFARLETRITGVYYYAYIGIAFLIFLGPIMTLYFLREGGKKVFRNFLFMVYMTSTLVFFLSFELQSFLMYFLGLSLASLFFIIFLLVERAKNPFRSAQELFIMGELIFIIGCYFTHFNVSLDVPDNLTIQNFAQFGMQLLFSFMMPILGLIIMLTSRVKKKKIAKKLFAIKETFMTDSLE